MKRSRLRLPVGVRKRWKRACKDSESILPESSSQVPQGCLHPSHIPEASPSCQSQSPTGYSPTTVVPSQIISSTIGPSQVTGSTIDLSGPYSSAQTGIEAKNYPTCTSALKTDGNGSDIDTCHRSIANPLGDMEDDEFWAQASACLTETPLMDTVEQAGTYVMESPLVNVGAVKQAGTCVTKSPLVNVGTVEQASVTESNTCRVERNNATKKQATLFSFMAVKPSTKKLIPPPIATSGGSVCRTRKRAGKTNGVEPKMNSTKRQEGISTKTCPFYKWIPGN